MEFLEMESGMEFLEMSLRPQGDTHKACGRRGTRAGSPPAYPSDVGLRIGFARCLVFIFSEAAFMPWHEWRSSEAERDM